MELGAAQISLSGVVESVGFMQTSGELEGQGEAFGKSVLQIVQESGIILKGDKLRRIVGEGYLVKSGEKYYEIILTEGNIQATLYQEAIEQTF